MLAFNTSSKILIRTFFFVGTIVIKAFFMWTLFMLAVCQWISSRFHHISFSIHCLVSLFCFCFLSFHGLLFSLIWGLLLFSYFIASIAAFLLTTFSSTTKKTFPTTQMTNCWLVVNNSSSMSYFSALAFSLFLFSFYTAVSFSWSHFHSFRRHSNMQYCPYWYDRCLQQHAMLLMTDDHIGSSWMTLYSPC